MRGAFLRCRPRAGPCCARRVSHIITYINTPAGAAALAILVTHALHGVAPPQTLQRLRQMLSQALSRGALGLELDGERLPAIGRVAVRFVMCTLRNRRTSCAF